MNSIFETIKNWIIKGLDKTKINNPITYVFLIAGVGVLNNLIQMGYIPLETGNQFLDLILDNLKTIIISLPVVVAGVAGRRTNKLMAAGAANSSNIKDWVIRMLDKTKMDSPVLYVFVIALSGVVQNLFDLGQLDWETNNDIVNLILDAVKQFILALPVLGAGLVGRRTSRYLK
ncbi:MAG: hypothetical protein AAGJ18_20005 [Bacteroidota bacterium]